MPKTILIADDNDDLRSILAYQLMARGYRILTASDGDQAVSKCKAEKPDLVLLDVLMPGKDGSEAGAEIRDDPATRHIPVIFLTALVSDSEEIGEPTNIGGRLTIPKSTNFEDLIARIEEILKK